MSETGIEKRRPGTLKEKGQYAMALGVIGMMLYFAGFPIFLLFFVGVLTFFVWKVFTSEGRSETRRIFEFYLSANEILREDDRRWYGFEVQETIARGENVIRSMVAAPPLLHFCLGALYQKIDDHANAVKHLAQVVDEDSSSEISVVYPPKELREYVRMLRKMERAPAEAPLTAAAIRALERFRKNRGKKLLAESRIVVTEQAKQPSRQIESIIDADESKAPSVLAVGAVFETVQDQPRPVSFVSSGRRMPRKSSERDRKTISEVLHDIYDRNVQ